MSYKVQFLNDEEFDRLPATDIHSKVGVAYPATGEAYVRRTGTNVIDVFTAMHELEHLEGDDLGEHFDKENGCYYKGFGDVFKRVAPLALGFLAPVLAPALAPMFSGLGGVVKGIGGNFGLGNIFGQFGNAIGGAAKSVGGALGMGGSSGSSAGAMSKGASDLGMLGPAGNAGRIGAGQMIGGTAAYDAAPNMIATGASSALGQGLKQTAGKVASEATTGLAQSMFAPQTPMDQFGMAPSMGSSSPNTQSNPNVIAGASGEGSQGGPGGSPGSVGGGAVSKLKQYLQQQGGNGGNGQGGMF